MAMWDGRPASLAARCAATQASHLGRRTGLVDEHELAWVEVRLAFEPRPTTTGDVRPILLGGVRGFF